MAGFAALESNRLEAAAPGQTQKIAGAAAAFLDTLDDTQRGKVSFAFDDAAQRIRWSNLPVSMAEHRGLRMGDLKASQRDAVMNLLSTALSKMGYEKVLGIVESDEILRKQAASGAPAFGRDEYFISFLGKPSATEPWIIQFGGHHLALNITIAGEKGVLTPSLIAVQPGSASIEQLAAGQHTLSLTNAHLPAISVYLVNALVPKDRAIKITKQTRDELQKTYRLEFGLIPPSP